MPGYRTESMGGARVTLRALIVEDGRSRGALAAVRGLSAAGWSVGVGWPGQFSFAASSRHVRYRHEVPSAAACVDGFLEAVKEAVRRSAYDVVFGAGDAEVLALSSGRDHVGAVIPYGPHEGVVRIFDKLHLYHAAIESGVPTPLTEPASASAVEHFGRPMFVKARLHAPGDSPLSGSRWESTAAADGKEALRLAGVMRANGREPLIQQHVDGELMALAVLVDRDGASVAVVQQVADRVWPRPAGVSVRARTVAVDQALLHGVVRLLRSFKWFGLAQAQFLAPHNEPPQLIDLNGRFYGSMALAIRSGVNFPALWAALATGRETPSNLDGSAHVGIRYQWLEGDLRRAVQERESGLIRDVASCLGYATTAHQNLSAVTDPMPLASYGGDLVRRVLRTPAKRWRRAFLAAGDA